MQAPNDFHSRPIAWNGFDGAPWSLTPNCSEVKRGRFRPPSHTARITYAASDSRHTTPHAHTLGLRMGSLLDFDFSVPRLQLLPKQG